MRDSVFKNNIEGEVMLHRLRAGMTLKSLVAEHPRTGARFYTAPSLFLPGHTQLLIRSALKAGWRPCYVVNVRLK